MTADPTFHALRALLASEPDSIPQITHALFEWRSTFSFKWFRKYYEIPGIPLTEVWSLFFSFLEFQDANVRISVFNCIGALLLSLTPYRTRLLIETFTVSIRDLPVSPSVSIAVISCFVYLSNQVGPHKLVSFLEAIPVLHHLSADLRPFAGQLPGLIAKMERLDIGFHQALLRSILSWSGTAPDPYAVECVITIVSRFPDRLMEYFLSSAQESLLFYGAPLLRKFGKFFPVESRARLFELARSNLENPEVGLTEFQHAVAAMCAFRDEGDEAAIALAKSIVAEKVKPHLQRTLFALTMDFECLRLKPDDIAMDARLKITNFARFSPEHDREILDSCLRFVDNRDDLFVAVVNLFAAKPAILTANRESSFLSSVLRARNFTWVQQEAIVSLIDGMNQFTVLPYMTGYLRLALEFLIWCSLSRQEALAQRSRKAVAGFLGQASLSLFIDILLVRVDFFDSHVVESAVLLLSELTALGNFERLRIFVPFILESIVLFPDDSFVIPGFQFISHFRRVKVPRPVIELGWTMLQQVFWSFTHTNLAKSPADVSEQGPIVVSHTSDIVANPGIDVGDLLRPLRALVAFLNARKLGTKHSFMSLRVQRKLAALLPTAILPSLDSVTMDGENLTQLIAETEEMLDYTTNESVIAEIARFLMGRNCSQTVADTLTEIATIGAVKSKELGWVIVQYIDQKKPKSAVKVAKSLLASLDKADEYFLAVQLFSLSSFARWRKKLASIYTFLGIKTAPKAVHDWLIATPVNLWPLGASDALDKSIVRLFEIAKDTITLTEFDGIGLDTWQFIFRNGSMFTARPITRFLRSAEGQNTLKRIRAIGPTVSMILRHSAPPPTSLLGSAAPFLRRGVLPQSERLLKNFLCFSTVKIRQDQRKDVLNTFPKLAPSMHTYETRIRARVPAVDTDANSLGDFSVKESYLRAACGRRCDPGHMESLRTLLLQHIGRLKRPRQWFFMLRLLRISLICEDSPEKQTWVKTSTADALSGILGSIPVDSDFVFAELCALAHSTCSPDVLRRLAEKDPRLGCLLELQEDVESQELPSRILEIVRCHDHYSKNFISHLLDARSPQIFGNFILADGVFDVVSEHDEFLARPTEYATAIVVPASPLFVIGLKLVKRLIRRNPAVVTAIHSAIVALPECGYCVDGAISLLRMVGEALAGLQQPPEEAWSLTIIRDLFRALPSVTLAREFAAELVRCSHIVDSNALLFAAVSSIDRGFFLILVVVAKVFKTLESSDERAAFFECLNGVSSQLLKSRLRALVALTEGKIDEAFLCALAESDDDGYLEHQLDQLRSTARG
jgi:hypothetical protein